MKLTFDEGLIVTYSVRVPHGASETTVERARRHFDKLSLGDLYSEHAAVELVDRKVAFPGNISGRWSKRPA